MALPLILAGASAIPGLIGGIMSIVNQARAARGGRGLSPMYMQRPYVGCGLLSPTGIVGRGLSPMYMQRPYVGRGVRFFTGAAQSTRKRGGRGRGVVADVVDKIPLLGSVLGPLIRSLGGRISTRPMRYARNMAVLRAQRPLIGQGLSPMYMQRPYVGCGLLSPTGIVRGGRSGGPIGGRRGERGESMLMALRRVLTGTGLSPMYMQRPYVGQGLLSPGQMMAGPAAPMFLGDLFVPPRPAIAAKRAPGFTHNTFDIRPFTPTASPPYVRMSKRNPWQPSQNPYPGTFAEVSVEGSGFRRGHYRKVAGRGAKVRVAATTVRKRGGYFPGTWGPIAVY